ncbi:19051_t:CDS:2 [Funneliformis geosporum]|nr:19051_t:CDS:2 [Funneliformis geosporum]
MAVELVNEPRKTLNNNMSVRKSKHIEQSIKKITMNKFKTITNQELLTEINPDVLYNLVENLKATLKLLADQESPKEKDEFGQPLILEVGLCTLVDEYNDDD